MNFSNLLKAGAGLAIAMLSSSAFAQTPEHVRIRSISYAGSGCPAGTVSQNVASDLKAFTLLFDSYIAETGPGVALREARKNCQIAVDLQFPSGWSYSILDVDYRGYASLERGVTGEQQSAYYFQGQARTATLKSVFRGPTQQDYQIRDSLGLEAVVWSPCGASRALNINTQVRLTSTNRFASGLLTTDSIDGELTHVYGVRWRRC